MRRDRWTCTSCALAIAAQACGPAFVEDGGGGDSGSGSGSSSTTSTTTTSTGAPSGPSCDDAGAVSPPCVEVPPAGPYGTRSFSVPAATYWVNAGLYLKQGEEVTLSASGTWTAGGSLHPGVTGPDGDPAQQVGGCNAGALVARLGLGSKDPVACVGAGTTFVAGHEGILYLGALVDGGFFSPDDADNLGFRLGNAGALSVTVTSNGATVPTVFAEEAAAFDFSSVVSGWVELRSAHTTITTPAAIARTDRATIAPSLAVLDTIYTHEAALRGMTPFSGERIRFFPDATVEFFSIKAGNPMRILPRLLDDDAPDERLLASSDLARNVWNFAQFMGNTFAQANGLHRYQQDTTFAWQALFGVFAMRAMARPDPYYEGDLAYARARYCDGEASYLANGTYDDFRNDLPLQICFLLAFEEAYTFEVYQRFFDLLNQTSAADMPVEPPGAVWAWVRDRLSTAAGEDVTPVFTKWKIPLM